MTSERITKFGRHVLRLWARRSRLDRIAAIRERELRLRMSRKVLEREVECLDALIDRHRAQVAIRRGAEVEHIAVSRAHK